MSSTSPRVSTGVAGLITTPARHSCCLIRFSVRFKCRHASGCTEIQSAPASAKSAMYWSGFAIIRWQSSGSRVARRKDFTTGGPIVRLGTKCPSMTSTWITLPPPAVARSTWSARWAKSAESIEGASSIKIGSGVEAVEILARCGQRPSPLVWGRAPSPVQADRSSAVARSQSGARFRKPSLLRNRHFTHLLDSLRHRVLQLLNPLAGNRGNRIKLQLLARRPLLQFLELLRIRHIDFGRDHQCRLLLQIRTETRQLAPNHLNILHHVGPPAAVGDIHHMHQQTRALDVSQELCAETRSAMRSFDQTRDVGDHKTLFFPLLARQHHTQVRFKRGKRIIRHL